ncbi:restriction endonuclease subunit S [Caloramator proteoclasticus]|uniref:Type I restriction enzyme, S subunit n=1 Tax=Caloramator proteoclasticus DSM 10124 TaxID=1121262 RepID=A0A1M5B3Z5_9CLOT|nr:restriction endonuclease subunit S [Caloramator proteoclasticus]SHF37168.1 type I restriction enzyme, S subunit [Caloramator proteoclasticus DSM 10124]
MSCNNSFQTNYLFSPIYYADDWKCKILYDLATWKNGLAFKNKDFSKAGRPIIKIAELKNGITPQTKYTNKFFDEAALLKKGDLLFSWSGNPDTSIDVFWFDLPEGWLNQHIFKITVDERIADKKYFYYLLKYLKPNFKAIASNKQTTGLGHVTISDLKNIIIKLPPLHEQKAIAKILSDLDEKIEINNRINKVLEEIAQTIFKRWFIDFEFPNENGEPYKSSGGEMVDSELGPIPKGWEVVELGQFIEIINGYSYKSSELMESNTALLTIKNFDVTGNFKINGFKEIKISEKVKEKHYLELFDVVIACTDLTQNAEIIGNAIMVMTKSKYKKLIASMDIIKIVPKSKKITQYTLYMILKDNRFKKFALGLTSGTTVLHLNKKGILNYKVALPIDSYLLEKISCFIEPLIKYMSEIYSENERLSQLRDTLLPKLMSGEIRVPLDEYK